MTVRQEDPPQLHLNQLPGRPFCENIFFYKCKTANRNTSRHIYWCELGSAFLPTLIQGHSLYQCQ